MKAIGFSNTRKINSGMNHMVFLTSILSRDFKAEQKIYKQIYRAKKQYDS